MSLNSIRNIGVKKTDKVALNAAVLEHLNTLDLPTIDGGKIRPSVSSLNVTTMQRSKAHVWITVTHDDKRIGSPQTLHWRILGLPPKLFNLILGAKEV